MLKDWTYAHLLDYVQYFDYPKENVPTLKFEIHEKNELGFLEGLEAFEKDCRDVQCRDIQCRKGVNPQETLLNKQTKTN